MSSLMFVHFALSLGIEVVILIMLVKIAFNDLRHIDKRLGELERIMGRNRR